MQHIGQMDLQLQASIGQFSKEGIIMASKRGKRGTMKNFLLVGGVFKGASGFQGNCPPK